MKFGCVIPARYGSTRLPGKPLADIAGKPMIERVYDRVSQATKNVTVLLLATDDDPCLFCSSTIWGNCYDDRP